MHYLVALLPIQSHYLSIPESFKQSTTVIVFLYIYIISEDNTIGTFILFIEVYGILSTVLLFPHFSE